MDLGLGIGFVGYAFFMEYSIIQQKQRESLIKERRVWSVKDLLEQAIVNGQNPAAPYQKNHLDMAVFNDVIVTGPLNTSNPLSSQTTKNDNFVYLNYRLRSLQVGGTISSTDSANKKNQVFKSRDLFIGNNSQQAVFLPTLASQTMNKFVESISKTEESQFMTRIGLMSAFMMPFRFTGFDVGYQEEEMGVKVGTGVVALGTLLVDKKKGQVTFTTIDGVFTNLNELYGNICHNSWMSRLFQFGSLLTGFSLMFYYFYRKKLRTQRRNR